MTHTKPTPQRATRLYTLGLTDMGCQQEEFSSREARFAYLSEKDNCEDDWYTLDVYADGGIDFCLASVGQDALDDMGA